MQCFYEFFNESVTIDCDRNNIYYVHLNRNGYCGPLESIEDHYDGNLLAAFNNPIFVSADDLTPVTNKVHTFDDLLEYLYRYFDCEDDEFALYIQRIRERFKPLFAPHLIPAYWRIIIDNYTAIYILAEIDTVRYKQDQISKSLSNLKNNSNLNALFKKKN